MTPDQLSAIKARHAAATKGPYIPDFDKRDDGAHQVVYSDRCGALPTMLTLCFMAIEPGNEQSHDDTVFLAASWQDVADLIAEVERLRAENAALKSVAQWAQATLTALNGGDVQRESPLHQKLREVMIQYRAALDAAGAER